MYHGMQAVDQRGRPVTMVQVCGTCGGTGHGRANCPRNQPRSVAPARAQRCNGCHNSSNPDWVRGANTHTDSNCRNQQRPTPTRGRVGGASRSPAPPTYQQSQQLFGPLVLAARQQAAVQVRLHMGGSASRSDRGQFECPGCSGLFERSQGCLNPWCRG
jgi:hypothetical protein